ncbi:addiction module antidote protein [Armatimonas sp.]|uniref:addiction module antidote protein n=1 Tax=Armatimonas sp. TaxID=1872638 RepID=UPI00286AE208|nr:addiction module antidote protein [Armatimonas sp.]
MLKDFRASFAPLLSDPEFQREFLAALYEEKGAEGIFEGLREIATATKKMPEIAESAGVARTSLYRSLSLGGNPNFKTVRAALNTLGMDFAIVPKKAA